MASIRQNPSPDLLPDFRNLGVLARILLGVNAVALLVAAFSATDIVQLADRFLRSATVIEPLLFASLLLLYALSAVLGRLPYLAGCAAVLASVLVLIAILHALWGIVAIDAPPGLARMLALGVLTVLAFLGYFRLLSRAYSP